MKSKIGGQYGISMSETGSAVRKRDEAFADAQTANKRAEILPLLSLNYYKNVMAVADLNSVAIDIYSWIQQRTFWAVLFWLARCKQGSLLDLQFVHDSFWANFRLESVVSGDSKRQIGRAKCPSSFWTQRNRLFWIVFRAKSTNTSTDTFIKPISNTFDSRFRLAPVFRRNKMEWKTHIVGFWCASFTLSLVALCSAERPIRKWTDSC